MKSKFPVKLTCRLFGHDFRSKDERWIYASDVCRKCGLTKKEVGL